MAESKQQPQAPAPAPPAASGPTPAQVKAQDEIDRLYARGYLTTNDTATIKKLRGIIDGKPVEDKPAS